MIPINVRTIREIKHVKGANTIPMMTSINPINVKSSIFSLPIQFPIDVLESISTLFKFFACNIINVIVNWVYQIKGFRKDLTKNKSYYQECLVTNMVTICLEMEMRRALLVTNRV